LLNPHSRSSPQTHRKWLFKHCSTILKSFTSTIIHHTIINPPDQNQYQPTGKSKSNPLEIKIKIKPTEKQNQKQPTGNQNQNQTSIWELKAMPLLGRTVATIERWIRAPTGTIRTRCR